MMMAALGPSPGHNRAFILDKYFLELEKYWEDEKNNSIRHTRSTASSEVERNVTNGQTSASVVSVPSRVSAPARINTRIAGGSAGSMITETLSSDPTFGSHQIGSRVRSMQVLETLMAGGFPCRMRYRAFNIRYRCLAPFKQLQRTDDKVLDDCKLILDSLTDIMGDMGPVPICGTDYYVGRTYMFLSEGTRSNLELIRDAIRIAAATSIQSFWRGNKFRREVWPNMKRLLMSSRASVSARSASASVTYGIVTRISDRVGPGSASSRITGTGTVIVHGSEITSASQHNYGNTMSIAAVNAQNGLLHGTNGSNGNVNNARSANDQIPDHGNNSGSTSSLNTDCMNNDNNNNDGLDKNLCHANSGNKCPSSSNGTVSGNRPRPQPIIGTPPPDKIVCDVKVIEQICSLFGLSLERPPPVPPSRPYKVVGNIKVMKKSAPLSVS